METLENQLLSPNQWVNLTLSTSYSLASLYIATTAFNNGNSETTLAGLTLASTAPLYCLKLVFDHYIKK